MATNKYFNNVSQSSEQDLFESAVIEMIQISGVDILYIPREIFDFDPILKEPKKTTFRRSFEIEAYMPDTGQFGGEQNIMSQFGFRINQTTEFIISRKRFAELGTGRLRPKEGDLIYVGNPDDPNPSFTNTMWEINQVWYNNPDWQFGKHFTYRIVAETFAYSHEKFQTGKDGIDKMQISNEDELKSAVNQDIVDFKQDLLVWDKNNPFGEL